VYLFASEFFNMISTCHDSAWFHLCFRKCCLLVIFLINLKDGPWFNIYDLVVQEHEATIVGKLLGMTFVHCDTMDPIISKVISNV
jgi:hypothetical protein